MKRAFDIVTAAAALAILSPFIVMIALLVRWKLGSPVLFRQLRPGKGARPFKMLKFRTMTDARDSEGRLLKDAKRLTPFGRFLRSTSLDELPELWNVLIGDMSLVGPRPLLMEYLPYYTVEERRRHDVRPGITGWAQVNGRNTAYWRQRLENDIWYVNNLSILLDIRVLAITIKKAILKDGFVSDPSSAMFDLNIEREVFFKIQTIDRKFAYDAANIIQRSYDLDQMSHTIMSSDRFGDFCHDVAFLSDKFIGAFREGNLIGVIQAREMHDSFHLNNIAVVEEERGWGVADALMREFLRISDGRRTDLFVDSRNAAAIRFYRRLGYREDMRQSFSRVDMGMKNDPIDVQKTFRVSDLNRYQKYGFCHLSIIGEDQDVGFVSPDNIFLSNGADPEILTALLTVKGRVRITFPSQLDSFVPDSFSLTRWERIRMTYP